MKDYQGDVNRTTRYKLLSVLAIVLISGIALFCLFYFRLSLSVAFLLVVLALVPARLQGAFWRDFYRGGKLLGARDWENSLKYSERFLADIKRRPRLKHLIWLGWGGYTQDIEVMTHNNIGVALLNLGRLEEAEHHLNLAREIDGEAPLPCYNLALLAQMRGDSESARSFLERSQQLGFTGATSDRLFQAAGAALAQIEGHGAR